MYAKNTSYSNHACVLLSPRILWNVLKYLKFFNKNLDLKNVMLPM